MANGTLEYWLFLYFNDEESERQSRVQRRVVLIRDVMMLITSLSLFITGNSIRIGIQTKECVIGKISRIKFYHFHCKVHHRFVTCERSYHVKRLTCNILLMIRTKTEDKVFHWYLYPLYFRYILSVQKPPLLYYKYLTLSHALCLTHCETMEG